MKHAIVDGQVSIYHDLEGMKMVAVHQAKEFKCNFNVILKSPDENGEWCDASTYEMVGDSYFENGHTEKSRNCIKIVTTDQLIKEEFEGFDMSDDDDDLHEFDGMLNDPFTQDRFLQYTNPYAGLDTFHDVDNTVYVPVTVRDGKKLHRNDPCSCESGKKFKKCCINKTKDNE
jgi:hypothetical protein